MQRLFGKQFLKNGDAPISTKRRPLNAIRLLGMAPVQIDDSAKGENIVSRTFSL